MNNWNLIDIIGEMWNGSADVKDYSNPEEDFIDEKEFSDLVQSMVEQGTISNNCRNIVHECIEARRNFKSLK